MANSHHPGDGEKAPITGSKAGLHEELRGTINVLFDRYIRTPLGVISFWSAVTLPVLYVPLFLGGVRSSNDLVLFLGLFGLHVLALTAGRDYQPDSE